MEVCFMVGDQPAAHEQYQLRQGDPVIAKPDQWEWSDTERRVFLIVRFPDDALTADGWSTLVTPQIVTRVEGQQPMTVQLRARRYRLDMDKVTPARKAEIVKNDTVKPISEGEFTIRDLIDKESTAIRFRNGDTLLSGRI